MVTVVDELADADAILRTRILQVRRNTASVASKTDTSIQFDTTLTIAAELKRVTGAVLWQDPGFSVTKSYGGDRNVVVTSSSDFLSGSLGAVDLAVLQAESTREVARGQEDEALASLTDKVAKIIYDSAVAPDF